MNELNIKLRTIDYNKILLLNVQAFLNPNFFLDSLKKSNLFFVRHSVIDILQSLNFDLLKKTAFLVDLCKNFIISLPFFPGGR